MNDDDDVNANGYGSLGGLGAESHHQIKSRVTGTGIAFVIPCDGCPRELGLEAPWMELCFMSKGAMPPAGPNGQPWVYNQHGGCFMPNNACPVCRTQIRLGVTPDECVRHLKSGVAAGKISAAQVQGVLAKIQG